MSVWYTYRNGGDGSDGAFRDDGCYCQFLLKLDCAISIIKLINAPSAFCVAYAAAMLNESFILCAVDRFCVSLCRVSLYDTDRFFECYF